MAEPFIKIRHAFKDPGLEPWRQFTCDDGNEMWINRGMVEYITTNKQYPERTDIHLNSGMVVVVLEELRKVLFKFSDRF